MRSIVALLFLLVATAVSAETLEAGRWRVVTTPLGGPPAPPQVTMRCLTPDEVADPGKTFAPQVSTVNSECERTEFKLDSSSLSWRLQCKGQLDMDVAGQFVFGSATRYTALVTTKAAIAGRLVQESMMSIAAERVGDCS